MSTTAVSTFHSIGPVCRIAAVKIVHLLMILSLLVSALPEPTIHAGASGVEPSSQELPTPQSGKAAPLALTPLTRLDVLRGSTPNLASFDCDLYPIAISADSLTGVTIGDTISDILNGVQPGTFGWLTWTGDPSTPTLITSLTPPGDSSTYINPKDPNDHGVSSGDWMQGRPGVSNASDVRQALDTLMTRDIDIPVWDQVSGSGNNTQYYVVDFVRVRLTDYDLPGQNRISALFLGYSCGSGTPTPTATFTPTDTPALTPTNTSTPSPTDTLTPTPTDTPTLTFTPTSTDTKTLTPTLTPTATDTPTATYTSTLTATSTPTSPSLCSSGKIVVDNDEWTITDAGFLWAPDTGQYVRNIANWFTGGKPGKFLRYGRNVASADTKLAATMIAAGNSWTDDSKIPFTLPNLLQYDGIFLEGISVDNQIVIDYVNAGGNVYLAAGTGVLGGAAQEAAQWNTFLGTYGLQFEPTYNGIGGVIPINSIHPIFSGVSGLYQNNGNWIDQLSPSSPGTEVFTFGKGQGLYAVVSQACGTATPTLSPTSTLTSTSTPSQTDTPTFTPTSTSTEMVIPYMGTGYRYLVVNTGQAPAGFEQPNFDDSAFPIGDAPFGTRGTCLINSHVVTSWPINTDIVLRKKFTLPPGATGLKVAVAIDNDVQVFVNGVDVSGGLRLHSFCASNNSFIFSVPDSLVNSGENLVAVLGRDRGGVSYLDIQVTVALPGSAITPTPTDTATPTNTFSPTSTSTYTPTPTQTLTPTLTYTPTPSSTPTATPFGPPPIASLTSPLEAAIITERTNVIGTASSGALANWKLEYRLQGDPTYTTFASGNASVVNDALGTFDPTVLLNGIYEIRLTATDLSGRSTLTSVNVVVEGQAKVGNFTISFIDLDVPVAGMPIQVIRTYNSRDKRTGDFGVGWTLSLTDMRLQENGTQGMNWQGSILPNGMSYCIEPTRSHIVTITLPDNQIYKFMASISPNCSAFAPPQVVNVVYQPLPGTNATLTQLDFPNPALVSGNFPGSIQLLDQNTYNLYDPNRYQLTLQDGRKFAISQKDGLQTITDLNGNILTFTQNGITHSAGKSVTFTRDTQGRITAIKDPAGNSLTYEYDSAGDLTAFIDRENNKTTFTYDSAHYLQDIHDPLGRQPIRNEYDAIGRLISHTDAFGKKILYTHDLEARIEIIQDRNGNQRVLAYDERGNVIQETDPEGNIIQRTFDSRDNRLSETEPHDPATTNPPTTFFTYDTRDNLLTTKDPLGNLTVYTYNNRDQVLTIKDPNQNVTTNTYDAKGNLTETLDPMKGVTKYTYDARGNVLTITDALTGVTKFEYDNFGNLTKEINALLHETTYTYDANGNRMTETRTRTTPSGVETLVARFTYDKQGRLIKTEDPDGTTTEVTYSALGQQIATNDKLGRPTSYGYDDLGRLIKTTFPDSTTEEMTYDAEGRRLSFKDRANRVTRYEYDTLGRLIKTTFPDDTFTTNTYDAAGRLIATTDGRGKTTTYEYDAVGRRTKVIDPLSNFTTFTYDPNGNQISFTDPNKQTTSYQYDALNRRIKTIFPDSVSTTTKYDSLGRRIEETDRGGKTTRFEYDALGQLLKVIDALNQETTYTYDEVGNFITQTDANGHTTRFEYDALGRQTKRTLPDGKSESQTYDAVGNLKTHKDFNGLTITYQYAQLNDWLALRLYPDGSQVSFTYTPTGQRLSVTDTRGETRYTYDLRDQLKSLTYPDGRKLEYAYDNNGNRISLTATIGTTTLTTAYAYDDAGRLDTVTDPQSRVYDYGYDANGNRTSLAYPNGTSTQYEYDSLNQLINLTTAGPGGAVQSYKFTLGPAGNRVKIEEQDGTAREYTYDDLYRLTGEKVSNLSGPVYQKSFRYDPVGNRVQQVTVGGGGGTFNYGYDARDRLLTKGTTAYTWDANGNLFTKSGEATYAWDFENRLTQVKKTDGTVISYAYDADGNRVRTTTTLAGVTTVTNYLVDPSGPLSQVVAETNASGNLIAYYVRGDDLLAMIRGSQTRFYHADGLGSIRRLTDESGNVTDTYTYTAFGELMTHTGTDPQPYTFAGEPFDPNSGFYYNRARWMDPRLGRFASMDLIPGNQFDPPSLHKYLYVRDDPANRTDPSGLLDNLVSLVNALAIRLTIFAISHPTITAVLEGAVLGIVSAYAGVDIPGYYGSFASLGREGARQLPLLARAFQAFKRLARTRIGRELEDFIFEIVLRGEAQRQIVILGQRIIGIGSSGPKGSRILDFIWRGIPIEVKLSQEAFDHGQFQVFVAFAKNFGGELWYFFQKSPTRKFVDEIVEAAAEEGVRLRVFSLYE